MMLQVSSIIHVYAVLLELYIPDDYLDSVHFYFSKTLKLFETVHNEKH